MLRAILYLSTFSPISIFSSFSLARLNWLYDVIIYLVRLTQIFATAHHNIKMLSKIATFLQNHFTKKLICGLFSQLIFKFFFNKLTVISMRFR